MVRVTNSVASRRSKRRILRSAKGFVGDRKNHRRLTTEAVLRALSFNYKHRKHNKRQFRSLWITRIGIASRVHGLSYSKLIHGLAQAGCEINRKVLSEIAIHDPKGFGVVCTHAKSALA